MGIRTRLIQAAAALTTLMLLAGSALASEADIIVPALDNSNKNVQVEFLGMSGHSLLLIGLAVCAIGLLFGLAIYQNLKKLPVHRSMREISELIYETCKTYLLTQGKFLMFLWVFIGAVMVAYFGVLKPVGWGNVAIIMAFSLVGIGGSYGVAWFGIRVNTFANSRTAFAALAGKPFPAYAIPLRAGISIGTLLIAVELLIMLAILLFIPGDIADCTGDNAGDSVGPTADGFETYGVTGVALITFILLAVPAEVHQVQLLVWIFAMRVMMIVTSILSYFVNDAWARGKYGNSDKFNFEIPLTSLVWITSFVSIGMTYLVSYLLIPELGNGLWWKLSTIITCGTLAGAIIPELVKVFTSVHSGHVKEVVTASKEGGPSLNILSGLVAGNFSAYWMGFAILGLMGGAYWVSTHGLGDIMAAYPVFAFGLVAFGFLGMGPVTIAVDSYGPVTDNAQSVYELSTIETLPGIEADLEKEFKFKVNFERAKMHLEENDGAGNTFKATAKPVLIGTAVVGATTLIFSLIVLLATGGDHGQMTVAQLNARLGDVSGAFSMLNPLFLLGLIAGGAVIYWFTGASIQAVSTGAYRAVEFIKANINLDTGSEKASIEDSKKVVAICTQYAQKGMFNIFLTVFFSTLAFACFDAFFFVGYLISIALFGLYQAIFMANAGGAWDNAKKIVETELRAKGTPLHDATVVGDTVGDPFKDTSSVAMNPIIKFTTLFGLLAVELAIEMQRNTRLALAAAFFLISTVFVWRSFYAMRIGSVVESQETPAKAATKEAA